MEAAQNAFDAVKNGGGDEKHVKLLASIVEQLKVNAENNRKEAEVYAKAFESDGARENDIVLPILTILNSFKTVPEYLNCTKTTPLGKEIVKRVEGF